MPITYTTGNAGIHQKQRIVPPSAEGISWHRWYFQQPVCDPAELEAFRRREAAREEKREMFKPAKRPSQKPTLLEAAS